MKKTTQYVIVALVAVVVLISIIAAISNSKFSLVGEYEGTAGSYLKLNKDGTCYYGENDSTGAGRGEWYVENDVLHLDISLFYYDVYADIEDMDGGFLLEAESSSWNAEYFCKID